MERFSALSYEDWAILLGTRERSQATEEVAWQRMRREDAKVHIVAAAKVPRMAAYARTGVDKEVREIAAGQAHG